MNRRKFLFGVPVAAAVLPSLVEAAVKSPKQSTLRTAEYTWKSFHDGFAFCEQPDMILCSGDFYYGYKTALAEGERKKEEVRSLRQLARNGMPHVQRRAYAKLRTLKVA